MKTLDGKETHWTVTHDRNPRAQEIADRHYSRKHPGSTKGFVGPGEKIVLISEDNRALFVWLYARAEMRGDGIDGAYCSIFRNEGPILSSELIREAERFAREKWPDKQLFTYVNPKKIKSSKPGYCFIKADWKLTGKNKSGKLLLFTKERKILPDPE